MCVRIITDFFLFFVILTGILSVFYADQMYKAPPLHNHWGNYQTMPPGIFFTYSFEDLVHRLWYVTVNNFIAPFMAK